METIEELVSYFAKHGYRVVAVNMWRNARLYVNVEGEDPFYYAINNMCRVQSPKMIAHELYRVAMMFKDVVEREQTILCDLLSDGAAIRFRKKEGK